MTAEFRTDSFASALSSGSLQRLLTALAEATATTVVLFDSAGEAIVGPVPGSEMIRRLLEAPAGRTLVMEAHRAQLGEASQARPDALGSSLNVTNSLGQKGTGGQVISGTLLCEHLDHFAVPVVRGGQRAGTLALGDRPRRPLAEAAVRQIATAANVDGDTLLAAAGELPCWTAAQAEAGRNLAAVVVELVASLCMQDEDLRSRIQELSAVYNIAGLLAGSRDLREILDKAARMVCEVMKVKACSIRLLDETSGLLTAKAVHNLSYEYLDKGPVSVDSNLIDQAALRGEMVRIADMPTDPRVQYPEEARREGIVSSLVCGMAYRGKSVGVIRVYTGEPHTFSAYEESLLQAVASQAAAAIVNVRLMSETLESERYARQLAYAGDVQRRMVPRQPPPCKQVEIGALYRPTYLVGGDFYDFIQLPKGNLGIGIADVSGKGVPASLQMASLRSALRVYAYFTYDVDKIMSGVNRHLCRDNRVGEFTTAFYGVLTPDGRRLTYCSAGHDPPIHLRDGKIAYLETGGMVLGVDGKATFERGLLDLQSGDIIFLYTDGVVEALNFADEQFGRQRLVESLRRYADQPAERIVQSINWDLRRFRGLADRIDDVTMVVLKIR